MDPTVQTVRHVLATLAYRFHKAIEGAPDGFAELGAGHGIRTPREIVHHMNGVLGYLREGVAHGAEDFWYEHPELDLADEIVALHTSLNELDHLLATRDDWRAETLHRIIQGPLADALTHVGQLAMLRRIAGDPIPSENFFKADVRIGRLGPDQAPPVSPDP